MNVTGRRYQLQRQARVDQWVTVDSSDDRVAILAEQRARRASERTHADDWRVRDIVLDKVVTDDD